MAEEVEASDEHATASLGSMVQIMYSELRSMAGAKLGRYRGQPGASPTSLVHDVYVRLLGKQKLQYRDEREFFLLAATSMRDILVERARRQSSQKAGGGRRRVDLSAVTVAIDVEPETLLVFDGLLEQLKSVGDDQDFNIVLLRFYIGLTEEQTAETLGISLRTLQRRWQYLRVRLYTWLDEARR